MKEWAISISATALLLILSELLLAEGKTKKYINGIFHFAIVIVIIMPLIKYINNKTIFDNIINEATPEFLENSNINNNENNYIADEIKNLKIKETEYKVEQTLLNEGIHSKIKIIDNNESNIKMEIYIYKNSINKEDENIYTNEKIIGIVQNIVDINGDEISIYETNANN